MTQEDWNEIAADCETLGAKMHLQEWVDEEDSSVGYILHVGSTMMNPEQYLIYKRQGFQQREIARPHKREQAKRAIR